MATVTLELTLEQLIQATRQLKPEDRVRLAQALLQLNRTEINRRFDAALAEVHAANKDLNEDQVMTEVNQIVHEIRAEWYAARRG